MTPEQLEAAKSLHKVIQFSDRKYRHLLHKAEYGKPMQRLQALHKLFTKHGFDEDKLRKHGIIPQEITLDTGVINASLDVQRMWKFDMRVWQYVGVYVTQAHVEFRDYYLSRAS